MTRRFLTALAALAPLFAWDGDRYKEDFRFAHALSANGRVNLESFNGPIEITAWERNEVEITGTKYASDQEKLKAIRVDVQNTADSVTIRATRPQGDSWWRGGGGGVRFVLRVPKRVNLERIVGSNGSIRLEGTDGTARLQTSNGPIRVQRVGGSLDLQTSNGGVELLDVNGAMMMRTSNGPIKADNVRGSFEATTSNGSIRARVDQSPASQPIRVSSSNGPIELTLPSWTSQDVRATTSNSSITISLPANANAELRAHTSNASIATDFEVSVRGSISKKDVEGKIGKGGALIDLTSSNGPIRIQRIGGGNL